MFQGGFGITGNDPEEMTGTGFDTIRIERPELKVSMWGLYLHGRWALFPLVIIVAMLLLDVISPVEGTGVIFLYIAIWAVAFYIHLTRNLKDAGAVELRHDTIIEFEGGRVVKEIPLSPTVEVDAILNKSTHSEEFGNLYGFRIVQEDSSIVISPHDNWELWDIQGFREPLLACIDEHRLRKGPTLTTYLENMNGTET